MLLAVQVKQEEVVSLGAEAQAARAQEADLRARLAAMGSELEEAKMAMQELQVCWPGWQHLGCLVRSSDG